MVDLALVSVLGLGFLWVFVAAACLPALRAAPVRRALADWQTGTLWTNYAVAVGLALLGHVLAFGAVVLALGGLEAITVPWGPVGVVVGYPLALWVAVAVGGPATGRWTPAEEGTDERVLLGLVALGYAVATAVGVALFAAIALAFL